MAACWLASGIGGILLMVLIFYSQQLGNLGNRRGLVFFGESGGTFTAVDHNTGKPVWHFETGQPWRASPMTYMVGGKQYVELAGAGGIFTFALVQ